MLFHVKWQGPCYNCDVKVGTMAHTILSPPQTRELGGYQGSITLGVPDFSVESLNTILVV
jgi:hypothetical protein